MSGGDALSHLSGKLLTYARANPIYVNPYNDKEIYVMITTGVVYSVDGGNVFKPADELTNFITDNGKYAFDTTTNIAGKNDINNEGGGNYTSADMAPLSAMAFSRDTSGQIVATSPYTGLFYKHGNNHWISLSDRSPQPLTPIQTVEIVKDTIYVGARGRGIYKLTNLPQ